MMSSWVDGGVKSKVLSGLFNLGCNETYTLFREWDGSALVCGIGSQSAQFEHAYAKAHAMNYKIMMDEGCADYRGVVRTETFP